MIDVLRLVGYYVWAIQPLLMFFVMFACVINNKLYAASVAGVGIVVLGLVVWSSPVCPYL